MTTVRTQEELDAALKSGASIIDIESSSGVWLEVTATGSSTVAAYGSSTVAAYGSSTVAAYGSSTVRAYGSSTVTASKYVAVHLHSVLVKLSGAGHVIDVTGINTETPDGWLDYYGPKRTKTRITVYKAVDQDLNAGQRHTVTTYPIGKTVKCPDWHPAQQCGNGLHFGPTPAHALGYYNGATKPRFLECTVSATEFVALGDKIKAPACRVIREVDGAMRPVKP